MLKKAVLPLSLKESRQNLYHMAKCMKHFGTEKVFLIHIMSQEDSPKKRKAEESIRSIANSLSDLGMQTETYFKWGRVADEVCKAATELEADYLGLHWRRKNVIKQTLLQSADADILRMCNLPVFIYKRRHYLEHTSSLNRVLYATDFQHTDSAVMPYLTNRDFQADTLYLLHVGDRAPDPYTEKSRREVATANLQRLARECSHAFNTVETLEVTGSVRWHIVREAKRKKADLIIVGKSNKTRPFEQMLGSIAETLPNKTNCSLFVVTDVTPT